jgi:hypothetical protein
MISIRPLTRCLDEHFGFGVARVIAQYARDNDSALLWKLIQTPKRFGIDLGEPGQSCIDFEALVLDDDNTLKKTWAKFPADENTYVELRFRRPSGTRKLYLSWSVFEYSILIERTLPHGHRALCAKDKCSWCEWCEWMKQLSDLLSKEIEGT